MNTRLISVITCGLWLAAVGTGLGIIFKHENTPGIAAASPAQWPVGTQIKRATNRATLVMLAHPKCPCTRASIGELALLMARCQGKVTAYVLFLKPSGTSGDWDKTDLWKSAAAIPGVEVRRDEGGLEARCFGVETSGQTMLYDKSGKLLFSGGITAARGHSGDNTGRDVIAALLNKSTAEQIIGQGTGQPQTAVFGCPLRDPDAKDDRNSNGELSSK